MVTIVTILSYDVVKVGACFFYKQSLDYYLNFEPKTVEFSTFSKKKLRHHAVTKKQSKVDVKYDKWIRDEY